ncbi:hypothetical protein GCM10017786_61710 [Amycolatopsis deserti]|uniref:Uncharacterized protein n=1 Tax=Amycolatopsis deserti TaxID=185696 RepID=A0ABQ3JEU9_9PSEU|nr:hypothetical protein GCM10017786_61710 [Amycolatopsis deserti]
MDEGLRAPRLGGGGFPPGCSGLRCQVVGLIDDLPTVADIVEGAVAQAEEILHRLPTRDQIRSMMVTLAVPPPSHMVCRP